MVTHRTMLWQLPPSRKLSVDRRAAIRQDSCVPRFTPPTPRSRRLGRRLRRLREDRGLTQEQAARALHCSQARIGRIETGDIKPRPRDVLEILVAYGLPHDDEAGRSLIEMARQVHDVGWWRQLNSLPHRYLTFIAYEAEAAQLHHFEPMLVPSLMQTPAYAREIVRARIEDEGQDQAMSQRAGSITKRQELLTARQPPLHVDALITEAALMLEIGDTALMREQLDHIIDVADLPNVTLRVLPFAAGAQLALHGGFQLLAFDDQEPPVGYVETPVGELFLESPREIQRITDVYDRLETLARSPRDSIDYLKERARTLR
jgi:transcriptional regulator with XRE-family HTH domain